MGPARPAGSGRADLAGPRLLSDAAPPPPAPVAPPRWGLGDAAVGLLIANGAALIIGAVILAATGNIEEGADGDLSLGMIAVLQIPLWAGYLGVPLYAARVKGHGLVTDFGLRMKAVDIPLGLGAGLVTQIAVIPAVYYGLFFPLLEALGWDGDRDLSGEARELTDKATDAAGIVLLVLVVVVLAPVIEELFFRGLLLRALEHRVGSGWALVLSSVVFGAVHLQALQFFALTVIGLVLGWLTQRTGRLGPAIWAHVAFNGVATAFLLADAT